MRSWGKRKLQEYAVDLLKNMVKIYSPTGKEERLARFLHKEMKGLGFNVRQDNVGNVIGELGEGSLKVLLCGHIDTVPPELPVKVEKGVLYGRGAVDAKGPLAALIIAASQMKESDYKGRLMVIGAVDEEGKNRGIKNIIDEGLEADYAIFGEPTNVDTITVGYRGGLLLKVTCKTETGHSSAPWLFQNSIEKAMEVWNLIKSLELQEKEQESRFHSTSYCLRKIRGGGESSIVPSHCEALIEARIPPSITVEEQSEKMLNVIKSYNEENPSVIVDTEILDYTEPYMSKKRTLLVRALSRSIWNQRRVPVKLVNKTGTGDMNLYGHSTGKPVVTYGPGDPHLDHTPNEHIKIQNYLDSISIIKGALESLSRLHDRTTV